MKVEQQNLGSALLSLLAGGEAVNDADLEQQIRFAAFLFDQDPDAAWSEFERNGPLARILRAALRSPKPKGKRRPSIERKHAIAECYGRHAAGGMSPKQAREATARDLSATGQNVTADAVEIEIRRNGLTYLFG